MSICLLLLARGTLFDALRRDANTSANARTEVDPTDQEESSSNVVLAVEKCRVRTGERKRWSELDPSSRETINTSRARYERAEARFGLQQRTYNNVKFGKFRVHTADDVRVARDMFKKQKRIFLHEYISYLALWRSFKEGTLHDQYGLG